MTKMSGTATRDLLITIPNYNLIPMTDDEAKLQLIKGALSSLTAACRCIARFRVQSTFNRPRHNPFVRTAVATKTTGGTNKNAQRFNTEIDRG